MALSRQNRIPRRLFSFVLKKAKKAEGSLLRLKFLPSRELKVSFVISQKIAKKAHRRNLLKRRGYAIIREFKKKIKPTLLFFFFKPGSDKIAFSELRKEIIKLLRETKLLNE